MGNLSIIFKQKRRLVLARIFFGIALLIIVIWMVFSAVLGGSVFAAESDNAVGTSFFGDMKDDGNGCGVYTILNTGLDILSFGIGIAAIIGILVSGILYLTAKGNGNQMAKSRKRFLEIVIGIAAYVVLYAGLNFLLPGGKLNNNIQCESTTVSSNYGTIDPWQSTVTIDNNGAIISNSSSSAGSSTGTSASSSNAVSSNSEKLLAKAKELAWPEGTAKKKYLYNGGSATAAFKKAIDKVFPKRNWNAKSKKGAACDVFVSTTVRAAGIDSKFPRGFDEQLKYKSNKFQRITCKNCNAYQKSQPGDVVLYWKNKAKDQGHVLIRGEKNVYEAQFHANGGTYGHVGPSSKRKLNKKFQEVVVLRPL